MLAGSKSGMSVNSSGAPVIGQRSGLCSALQRNLLEGQYAIKNNLFAHMRRAWRL
jgi:hypothetical protein